MHGKIGQSDFIELTEYPLFIILFLRFNIFQSKNARYRSICSSSYNLAERFCSDVTHCKDARYICTSCLVRNEVATFIPFHGLRYHLGVGYATYAHEQSLGGEVSRLTGLDILDPDTGPFSVFQKGTVYNTVQNRFNVFCFGDTVNIELFCPVLLTTMDQVNFFTDSGQIERILQCGVAAAVQGDCFAAEPHAQ